MKIVPSILVIFALLLQPGLPYLSSTSAQDSGDGPRTPLDSILYVKTTPTGAGDCSTWDDACGLQTALGAAEGDEIWVQAGEYKTTASTNRNASFSLESGVGIYGGFAGTETSRDQRNWETNLTTLSGDIGVVGDNSDNSYHVVYANNVDALAVLDGFTITSGNANVTTHPTDWGAGMYIQDSYLTIRNVVFQYNNAAGGGGMFINGGAPLLEDVEFKDNNASVNGGGLHTYSGATPTLTDVSFSGNSATENGGGMYNLNSSTGLMNVIFSGNSASHGGGLFNNSSSQSLVNVNFISNTAEDTFYDPGRGGGMYNDESILNLADTTFIGNAASIGGGMYNLNSDLTLAGAIFSGNIANNAVLTTEDFIGGGGMLNNTSNLSLVNFTFINNTAKDIYISPFNHSHGMGGGMYNIDSSLTLVNGTFINNTAEGGFLTGSGTGGGMYAFQSTTTLKNVTFNNNTAENDGMGGGIHTGSGTTMMNSILWGNSPNQITGSAVLAFYSDIQSESIYPGPGNINLDPLFVDATNGNLRLQPTSPAIDAGSNDFVPLDVTTDPDGNLRKVDIPTVTDTGYGDPPIVDMGAYEAQDRSDIIYVDKDRPGAIHDGKSWASAFSELQAALATAAAGDQIWVAAGVYYPGIPGNLRATFGLKDGVEIYGGFAGSEADLDERDLTANPTILSGDIDRDGLLLHGNAHHVVSGYSVDADAILDGFTVTAGKADGAGTHWGWGGGIYTLNSDLSIRNVVFESNSAESGGGMFIDSGAPELVRVLFSENTATINGGGLHILNGATPSLTSVNLSGNHADQWGGGMYTLNCSPTLTGVTLSSNSAESGGGMFIDSGAPELVNVVFSQNTATINGGGLHTHEGATPTLTNVTFSNNTAAAGGGIYNLASNPTLTNAIVWGNTPTQNQVYRASGAPVINYSDIQNGCPSGVVCSHTINIDPLFVNAAGGNLRLQLISPAIDAGDNDAVPSGVTTDLLGYTRFIDIASVPDTGNGTPPIVDMGAYEAQVVIYLPLLGK